MEPKPRTLRQNASLHKWCEELSNEFLNRGLDMRAVLKPSVEIPWDARLVKQHIIHPIIKAMYNKESTADLTTAELSKVVAVINRHLLQRFDLSLPFPSADDVSFNQSYDAIHR